MNFVRQVLWTFPRNGENLSAPAPKNSIPKKSAIFFLICLTMTTGSLRTNRQLRANRMTMFPRRMSRDQ